MSLMAPFARFEGCEAEPRSQPRTLSPTLSSTSTVSGQNSAAELSHVKLHIFVGGTFVQDQDGFWKYCNGEAQFWLRVPLDCGYALLMYRLTEKTDRTVSAKWLQAGQPLDPDNLVNICDNEDVQEMMDDYVNWRRTNPSARLRIFLFPGTEVHYSLSPEEATLEDDFLDSIPNSEHGSDTSSMCAGGGATTNNRQMLDYRRPHRGSDDTYGGLFCGGGSLKPETMQQGRLGAPEFGYGSSSRDMYYEQDMELSERSGGMDTSGSKSHLFYTQDPIYLAGLAGTSVDNRVADPVAFMEVKLADRKGDEGGKPGGKAKGFGHGIVLPSSISILGIKGDSFVNDSAGARIQSHALMDLLCTPRDPPALTGVHDQCFVVESPRDLDWRHSAGSNSGSNVHQVPRDDVKILRRIGEGAFGEVSLAHCATFGKVAVKWLKPAKMEKHASTFWKEAEILSSLNHPNVLRFYGAVIESHEDPAVVGIMTEYMKGGSLSQILRTPGKFPLSLRARAELALCAANGMAYLHEMDVVHFDLKPDNLLLENTQLFPPQDYWIGRAEWEMPQLKVADFGLSKHKLRPYVSEVHDLRGTLPYMAPELVSDPQHVTEKADVWSMGMCMWEMLTGQPPFHEQTPQAIISGLMCGNLQPEVPDYCEPAWQIVMEMCWDTVPASRPTFRQVVVFLQEIIDTTQ